MLNKSSYPHFPEEEAEAQRGGLLDKVRLLVRNREFELWFLEFQNPGVYPDFISCWLQKPSKLCNLPEFLFPYIIYLMGLL